MNTEGSHLMAVDIVSMDGRRCRIRAKTFVLACGGLENPRLLLNSTSVMSCGVGNQNDQVGRYLMDHLRSKHVVATLDDPYAISRIMNTYRDRTGSFLVGMKLSEELQRESRILNAGIMTYTEGGEDSSLDATIRLVKGVTRGKLPEHTTVELLNVLRDLDGLVMNVRREFLRPGTEALRRALITIVCESEQSPNPSSRVYLSDERDALGMRKLNVDWQLSELDLKTTQVMVNTLASQLVKHFRSRIRIPEWISTAPADWAHHFKDVSHPTGTTRMSTNPATGVVDANCRVHGVDNLYIAGSSVFPTTGQSNPTLTIVALALRLSDHLKKDLKRSA
jgi:choline dehydrogenase-like flavoprotein